ncbi:Imm6 family immunity protein [Priestia megaterium]|uniref:Imm6 family immunity protein n=1 Tax=Priestia megaterium TaxID=1404 RepID=UPI000BF7AD48|nr:Imm6 family immunity protein [Priestia megaterium]MCA4153672.1 immunity 6 family protein [Priestia megaterium]MDP1439405.1 Imm6 family immunity protein [Priestia megaterium]MDP1468422.1 Imm6 family immunity protein [Priestia megaterium]MED3926774.1 Imm6 family immunity protein [Priestia megaterium]MED4034965.1 Imm6 family immunity protein [Priestia megaterium]
MTNANFNSLTEHDKVIFFLALSEKVVPVLSRTEDQILARKVICKCWEWLKDKENSGDTLYELLDHEGNGITIIQEMSDNKTDVIVWDCIIDAVAYTSRKAFEREGVEYYPEPIALVNDTLVEHFIDGFERCIENADSYIERLTSLLNDDTNRKTVNDLRTKVLKELQIRQ